MHFLFRFFRFHRQRLASYSPTGGALCALAFLAFVCSACLAIRAADEEIAAKRDLDAARKAAQRSAQARAPAVDPAVSDALPPFSSADLTRKVHVAANDTHMPLGEITYAAASNDPLPYLRYHVSMNVNASYPEIRKFLAAISVDLPNLDLDAIHCARADIGVSVVSCELKFSAFFEKSKHGE